jgi:hypothetical protein
MYQQPTPHKLARCYEPSYHECHTLRGPYSVSEGSVSKHETIRICPCSRRFLKSAGRMANSLARVPKFLDVFCDCADLGYGVIAAIVLHSVAQEDDDVE